MYSPTPDYMYVPDKVAKDLSDKGTLKVTGKRVKAPEPDSERNRWEEHFQNATHSLEQVPRAPHATNQSYGMSQASYVQCSTDFQVRDRLRISRVFTPTKMLQCPEQVQDALLPAFSLLGQPVLPAPTERRGGSAPPRARLRVIRAPAARRDSRLARYRHPRHRVRGGRRPNLQDAVRHRERDAHPPSPRGDRGVFRRGARAAGAGDAGVPRRWRWVLSEK